MDNHDDFEPYDGFWTAAFFWMIAIVSIFWIVGMVILYISLPN